MSRYAVVNIGEDNLAMLSLEIAAAWRNNCSLHPIMDTDEETVVAYATSAENGITICSALEEQDEPIQTVAAGSRNGDT